MDDLHSEFEKDQSLVSVSLYNSPFVKEGEYTGKVTRNTVSLENIIAEIEEDNVGIDAYSIQHVAILLRQQILKMIRLGKSVNVLDLGIMYIKLKGVVKGNNPDSVCIPDLTLHFTPSRLVQESVKSISADKVVIADTAPKIKVIKDVWSDSENKCLTPGKVCHICGKGLKLGGNTFSLSLIKVHKNGKEDNTAEPLLIDEKKIFINTKSVIYFFIPEELDYNAKYKIRITTSYITNNRSRKTPVSVESGSLGVRKIGDRTLSSHMYNRVF